MKITRKIEITIATNDTYIIRKSSSGRKIVCPKCGAPVLTAEECVVLFDLEDQSGNQKRILTEVYLTIQGLSWTGDQIYFAASLRGNGREIKTVNLKGETLLFEEGGASGGYKFAAYTRKFDGSAVKKIGDGSALALAPDGKHALLRFCNPNHLALTPIGGGEIVRLETDPANPPEFAKNYKQRKRTIM